MKVNGTAVGSNGCGLCTPGLMPAPVFILVFMRSSLGQRQCLWLCLRLGLWQRLRLGLRWRLCAQQRP